MRCRIRDLIAANARPSTADEIAERRRYQAAREQMQRERAERYPIITADNAEEVIAWQDRRLAELLRERV